MFLEPRSKVMNNLRSINKGYPSSGFARITHSPFWSVEQIISEIAGRLPIASQAHKPMVCLRTAVPKCFIGVSVVPIAPAGCPMPAVHRALGECDE
jgi:hypothetical protein